MNYKIVADSSSNVFALPGVSYACAPLKIITREREYVDDASLDVNTLVEDLKRQTAPTSTSCPNMMEWLEAFGDAEHVFAITITSNLSGSFNAAKQAAEEYMSLHPGRKAVVIDSLSAGAELLLIMEKIQALVEEGKQRFEEIVESVREYQKHTHLLFALQSLANLARNGRVSPAVAKIASVLGICVMGKASDVGTLEPMHKCRGEKSTLRTCAKVIREMGFAGGKLRIDHCQNPQGAKTLADLVLAEFPGSDVKIGTCGGLCSYYAERGGLMIGFEDGVNA